MAKMITITILLALAVSAVDANDDFGLQNEPSNESSTEHTGDDDVATRLRGGRRGHRRNHGKCRGRMNKFLKKIQAALDEAGTEASDGTTADTCPKPLTKEEAFTLAFTDQKLLDTFQGLATLFTGLGVNGDFEGADLAFGEALANLEALGLALVVVDS